MAVSRRAFLALAAAGLMPGHGPPSAQASPDWRRALVASARKQLGVTTLYDPAYTRIAYPGGDVPAERGVCTDVVIRAYRDAFGLDLQKLVHEDMKAAFSAYPTRWGLSRPDPNIDHRRVPNLMVFFRRRRAEQPLSTEAAAFAPGDLVTQMLPGNLPHIVIVSDSVSAAVAGRPLVIQNIGQGAREDDSLFEFPHTGHFRFAPAA